MKWLRFVGIFALVAYLTLFSLTESYFKTAQLYFSAPLPAPVQQVALGFLRQIGAEMLYVKAAVFLGAAPKQLPPEKVYAENLVRNFDVLTDLYPEFKDAYFLAQSSLAHISPEYAGDTIALLDKGCKSYPDDLILPFFKGFDHYYYRDEAAHAAEIFAGLATHPEAPSWLGHLAAVLSARNGELYAGLMSLQVMYATEESEAAKARYAAEIANFQKAIAVLEATKVYEQQRGRQPQRLEELVPDYLPEIPAIENGFELLWIPPRLRLIRPLR